MSVISASASLVGAATPSGSRTIGERVRGRKSNGCASETFLFWRAAGEEIFALEPPNKPFSFDFQVGPTCYVKPLRSVKR